MATGPDKPNDDASGAGRDEPGAPDLPLHSIPSVPDDPLSDTEPQGSGPLQQIFAAIAILALIVVAALLGVRYVKLPKEPVAVTPPEEHRIDASSSTAAAPVSVAEKSETALPATVPGLEPAEPRAAPTTSELPPIEPAPANPRAAEAAAGTSSAEIDRLRRDLSSRTRELEDARRSLDKERQARRGAERKLEEAQRTADPKAGGRSARAEKNDKLDKRGQKRLKELEAQVATLRRDLDAARKQAETAEERARAAEEGVGTVQTQAQGAEKRARSAEAELQASRARHEQALKGESEAVRKLVAQLDAAKREAATEKAARVEAERKLRALESSATAPRASAGSGGGEAPARARAAEPVQTVSAKSVEPQRLKTPPPRYPEELRRQGVSGRVTLQVLVGASGSVEEVKVVSSPDRRLADVAADSARRWTYTPGRKDGLRSAMWITELVDFRL